MYVRTIFLSLKRLGLVRFVKASCSGVLGVEGINDGECYKLDLTETTISLSSSFYENISIGKLG